MSRKLKNERESLCVCKKNLHVNLKGQAVYMRISKEAQGQDIALQFCKRTQREDSQQCHLSGSLFVVNISLQRLFEFLLVHN